MMLKAHGKRKSTKTFEQLPLNQQFTTGTIFICEQQQNIITSVVDYRNGLYFCVELDLDDNSDDKEVFYSPEFIRQHTANSAAVIKKVQQDQKKANIIGVAQARSRRLAHEAGQNVYAADDEAEAEAAYETKHSLIVETSEHTPKLSWGQDFYMWCNEQEDKNPVLFMTQSVEELRMSYMEIYNLQQSVKSNEPTSIPHIEGESLSDFFVRAEAAMSESEKAAMTTEYDASLTQEEMFANNQTSNAESTSDMDIERLNSEPAKQTMRIGGTVDLMTGQTLIDTMEKLDISKNEALSMAITLLGSASKEQLRDALGYVYAKRLATIFED
jgi:hypothetical protein